MNVNIVSHMILHQCCLCMQLYVGVVWLLFLTKVLTRIVANQKRVIGQALHMVFLKNLLLGREIPEKNYLPYY